MEVALRPRLIVITALACGTVVSSAAAVPEVPGPPPAYGVDPTPTAPPVTTPTKPPESPPVAAPVSPRTPAPARPGQPKPATAPAKPKRPTAVEQRLARQVRRLQLQLTRERRKHRRTLKLHRRRMATRIARVERHTVDRSEVQHAFAIAAATYGVSIGKLSRVSYCESTHNPFAVNGKYLGLFQFGTSLWSRTPFASFPRTDPYAASLAASWAFSKGMQGHWPKCGRR